MKRCSHRRVGVGIGSPTDPKRIGLVYVRGPLEKRTVAPYGAPLFIIPMTGPSSKGWRIGYLYNGLGVLLDKAPWYRTVCVACNWPRRAAVVCLSKPAPESTGFIPRLVGNLPLERTLEVAVQIAFSHLLRGKFKAKLDPRLPLEAQVFPVVAPPSDHESLLNDPEWSRDYSYKVTFVFRASFG